MKKPKWPFVIGGAIGGMLVYFLEPKKGPQRRQKVNMPQNFTPPRVPGSVTEVVSVVKEKVRTGTPDNSNPDDNTLRDRIESEIFRDDKTSRENININVVEGVVEIRGEQPSQADIDGLVKKIRAISNVKHVHSYLHLPGTPAPNKAEVIQAS
jgi:BON domain